MTQLKHKRRAEVERLRLAFLSMETVYLFEQPLEITEHSWQLSDMEGFVHKFKLSNGSIIILEPEL